VRILFCDVDTLRADHTGPYGYPRAITPNLDEVARHGAVLESCYASDTPCAPSRAAFTSGQLGITTGAIGNFGPAADIKMFQRTRYGPFFGGHLYRHGTYTASISCFPERHMAYWYIGNFREWAMPSLSNGDDEDARDVAAAACDWLRRHGREEDWFLQVHFWDPHIPYMEDQRWFEHAAESGPPPAWPDEEAIAGHGALYGPHTALDLHEGDGSWAVPPPPSPNAVTMPDAIRNRRDFEQLITGYDGAIAYWDHHLGRILEQLGSLGILEETAIIVTSDHGESFGEHGVYGDHPMANEANHHVPMVISWPSVTTSLAPERRRISGLIYHLDLCPTICELLNLPVPGGWDGRSFAPALRGEPFSGRDHLVLSHGAYTYQRALRTPEHLYIATLHPGLWPIEREQLFAIDRDPHMTRDLSAERPGTARALAARLEEWRHEHATMSGTHPDPMEAGHYERPADAFSLDRYRARLIGTGRAHLAADLDRRQRTTWVTAARW